jgi:hypothetical protein
MEQSSMEIETAIRCRDIYHRSKLKGIESIGWLKEVYFLPQSIFPASITTK